MGQFILDAVKGNIPFVSVFVYFTVTIACVDSRFLSEKKIRKYPKKYRAFANALRRSQPIWWPAIIGCIGFIYRNPEGSFDWPWQRAFAYFGFAGGLAMLSWKAVEGLLRPRGIILVLPGETKRPPTKRTTTRASTSAEPGQS